jgi:hypothetical protein
MAAAPAVNALVGPLEKTIRITAQTSQRSSAQMVQPQVNKRYLTPKEAAIYLGIGQSTLAIHRMKGTGPKFISWATNIRYDLEDLNAWMGERRVTPMPGADLRRVGRPRKQEGKA